MEPEYRIKDASVNVNLIFEGFLEEAVHMVYFLDFLCDLQLAWPSWIKTPDLAIGEFAGGHNTTVAEVIAIDVKPAGIAAVQLHGSELKGRFHLAHELDKWMTWEKGRQKEEDDDR